MGVYRSQRKKVGPKRMVISPTDHGTVKNGINPYGQLAQCPHESSCNTYGSYIILSHKKSELR